MLKNIRQKLKLLFGKKIVESRMESGIEEKWEREYARVDSINFAEIFANRLTNYAIADSTISADDENVNELFSNLMAKSQKWLQMALSIGRVYLIPYLNSGKIYTDIIPQSRCWVTNIIGGEIFGIIVLADVRVIENRIYQRWTLYEYDRETKIFTVRNKASVYGGAGEVSMKSVPEWVNIEEETTITGAQRPLFAYIDSPKDNRTCDMLQGASITYGCDDVILQIRETLKNYAQEFELKKAFVGVDKLMIDKETGKPSPLFQLFEGKSTETLFEVFSPDIRDASYRERLKDLFSLLEKQVGTSSGILTPSETANATATQVRRSMFDTICMVDRIRKSVEICFKNLSDVYSTYLRIIGISTPDDIQITFDWDYSFIEDTSETFSQLMQGQSIGAIREAEIRQFLRPGESMEESEKAVKEIAATKPENPFQTDEIGV